MRNRLFAYVAAFVVVIILLSFFTPFGVNLTFETYFSPDRFVFRSDQYRELWGLPVSPRSSSEWSPPLLDFLKENEYLPSEQQGDIRWHFVHGSHPRLKGWRGDAKWAYKAFKREELIEWSKTNPDKAKYLWPKVIMLAHEEHYDLIWILLTHDSDPEENLDEFKATVQRIESEYRE